MTIVYDLWFIREYEHREDTELRIGIYATHDDADTAVEALKGKPGFRDFPAGFDIREVELGQTGWQYGFITKFGYPPKDADGEAFDLPAFIDEYTRGANDR